VSFEGREVAVGAGAAPASGAEVWLALYDPHVVDVPVARGENAGRTLPHKNVVHRLVKLGTWSGAAKRFPLPADVGGWSKAVLVQGAGLGPILAAGRG
jgi:hypothetical protein